MLTQTVQSSRRLTVGDAALHVGVAVSTLNKLRVYGGGPTYIKLGRRVLYDVQDIDKWLDRCRRTSTSAAAP